MPFRTFLLSLVALSAAGQFNPHIQINKEPVDATALEAAQKANPDDQKVTGALLRYYAAENHDPAWSNRFALLQWNIQHHPEAWFFSSSGTLEFLYRNMPQSIREQLKPLWVNQVLQHPDDPMVLRNAAAALDTTPSAIRVGGNVQASNLLHQVKPAYPDLARMAAVQGTVQLNATIGPEGSIQKLELASGNPLLAPAALEAVQQWIYRPTLLNGIPVSVITTIDVNFTLQP